MPSKPKPFIIEKEGLRLEWFARRSELDVSVYRLNADGTRGGIVSMLAYPKVAGIGFNDFTPEAISIAKRELARYPDCAHEEPHTSECRRVEER